MEGLYSIAPEEDLQRFCIQNNRFTCGTNEQYMKMLVMNREKKPLSEIAVAFWLCSDGVTEEEVEKGLNDLHEDYLVMLGEMRQAEGERSADEVYCAQFE